jgi:hypothetical protein
VVGGGEDGDGLGGTLRGEGGEVVVVVLFFETTINVCVKDFYFFL